MINKADYQAKISLVEGQMEYPGVMKKTVALAVLAIGFLFVVLLAGCHTWHGFGEDVSHTGNVIENSGK